MTLNKPYLTIALWLFITGFSGATLTLAGLYLYLSPKLPAVETLRQVKLQTPLRIYSSDNKLIGEFGEKRRSPIKFEEIPEQYIQAILAAEDDQFYAHHGVSIKGLMRAASQLLQTGHIQTGGSTITMQVARNFFLTRNQTFARKFNEILLALQIERELSKKEILELYINKIYLGNRAYGIQAAAKVYYGLNIDQLTLAQLAMIAGLPKAPSAYNPIVNPSRALVRRNWILGRMLELDYIDEATYQKTLPEIVSARYHGLNLDLHAPYVAEMARKEAVTLLGNSAYTDGYHVTTTIDSRLQASAQQAVLNGLITYDLRHGYRGPEQRLESAEDLSTGHWIETLQTIPTYVGLKPAAITYIGEQEVEALLGNGTTIVIPWENGLSSARPYLSEDRLGSAPKLATDLFSEGDIIRVRETIIEPEKEKDEDKQATETSSEDLAQENTDLEEAIEAPQSEWHLAQIPEAQAALVALNPENGAIRSLVGGFDFRQSHFNRAIQAARQPGSNFKPFIYTSALENGFTTATLINDAPIVVDDASLEGTWRPENSSGKFFGPTRLRQALYKSRNLVSIRILRSIGIPKAIENMDRFGFDRAKLPRDLSLALGSYALTPLQVATGYATFANGGYRIEPFLVDRIEDIDSLPIFEALPLTVCRDCELPTHEEKNDITPDNTELQEESRNLEELMSDNQDAETDGDIEESTTELPVAPRVLDEQVAYIIDSMLRDVVKKGTGRRAKSLGRNDLAGKTGTTNGPTDAWFSGYNPHIVATTWLGFDQNRLLGRREFGGSAALPIWIDYMRTALKGVPEIPTSQPNGLVTVRIDPKTGERALPGTPEAIFEIFRQGNAPQLAKTANNGNSTSIEPEEETLPEELF